MQMKVNARQESHSPAARSSRIYRNVASQDVGHDDVARVPHDIRLHIIPRHRYVLTIDRRRPYIQPIGAEIRVAGVPLRNVPRRHEIISGRHATAVLRTLN